MQREYIVIKLQSCPTLSLPPVVGGARQCGRRGSASGQTGRTCFRDPCLRSWTSCRSLWTRRSTARTPSARYADGSGVRRAAWSGSCSQKPFKTRFTWEKLASKFWCSGSIYHFEASGGEANLIMIGLMLERKYHFVKHLPGRGLVWPASDRGYSLQTDN